MSTRSLEGGRPIAVEADTLEGKLGPLARLLLTAVVLHPRSERAERGRALARDGRVHSIEVGVGVMRAQVDGSEGRVYEVELRAPALAERAWQSVTRSARGPELLEALLAGRPQALQLEHALTVDWSTPLVPAPDALRYSCTCPDLPPRGSCKHVMAVAYVLASAIQDDPTLLLLWRGCALDRSGSSEATGDTARDPWAAGPIPALPPRRPLPPGAVLKRLGRSRIELDGHDLAELLAPAYEAFAEP